MSLILLWTLGPSFPLCPYKKPQNTAKRLSPDVFVTVRNKFLSFIKLPSLCSGCTNNNGIERLLEYR
jgi:hypothetical protein